MLVSPGENHSRQPKPSDHGHGHGTARPVMRSVLPSLFNSSACDLSTARLPLLGRPNSGKETDNSRGARTDPTSCAQENERERRWRRGALAQAASELSAIGAVPRRQLGLPPPPIPPSTLARPVIVGERGRGRPCYCYV